MIVKQNKMSQQSLDTYFVQILQLLKNLAFHEIYMEKNRQQLCEKQFFDPFTAFKFIDSFKHNMIINVELKSFLEIQGYEITKNQAQEVIKSLNKHQDSLNYNRFLETVMPYDIKKRNLCLNRYNKMEVGIGTYQKLNQIKNQTKKAIAQFFIKQVQFFRDLVFQRIQFCKKWGGDVNTLMQHLFRNKRINLDKSTKNPLFGYQKSKNQSVHQWPKDNQISFDILNQFCRQYNCYFNKQEYKGIWRRIKCIEQAIVLKTQQIFLKQQDLISILLVNNFNTKINYAVQNQVPLKKLYQTKPPSYKLPISQQLIHNSYKYRQQKQNEYFNKKLNQIKRQINQNSQPRLKYKYSYPELQHNTVSSKLKQKQQDWKEIMQRMSDTGIHQRYQQILAQDRNKYIYK